MVNEWSEFLQYTGAVTYAAKSKRDASYLGRSTWDTLVDFEGLVRVLTVLARGFLFHEPDGSLADDPRGRVEYARRALCAWCSVPDEEGAAPREEWRYRTDFRDLHGEFPNLVDEDGRGWFWRHIRRVGAFVEEHPEAAPKTAWDKALAIGKGFDAVWRKKVIQFQTPLFSSKALGLWLIRFESVLADGLEQGLLRREDIALPPELTQKVSAMLPRACRRRRSAR